ncbi:hypothetical protein [Bradyrhizobium sp. CW1]|uniref:hypothetical protein n=1 Tax=Bradyrhizobium sp. CW1 TaxID=2782686 RepID=UPI001FFF44FF|nr:hypothetical protein [Bradyrhizobium sp. CW1]UPJ26430.1 hypothetical protein IVB54_32750 [Bradyrhizobium sp. CW1]
MLSISLQIGSDSYVEPPALQDLSLVEQGMTVRSYVRPVNGRLAAGHDDIRGSNRPINFSRSKRSGSGGPCYRECRRSGFIQICTLPPWQLSSSAGELSRLVFSIAGGA